MSGSVGEDLLGMQKLFDSTPGICCYKYQAAGDMKGQLFTVRLMGHWPDILEVLSVQSGEVG